MWIPIAVAGLASSAGALAYQSMSPRGQWLGETVTGDNFPDRSFALTFDDGPNDPWTLRTLDMLAKHGVKATFFLIAKFASKRPDIVREVLAAGHEIGNHTADHPNLIFRSRKQTVEQLSHCNQVLEDITGQPVALFRPPFGGRRPSTLRVARSLGLTPVMWNITGFDWSGAPSTSIEASVVRQISKLSHPRVMVLLHDGGHVAMGADRSQTVAATDLIVARYRSQGFHFARVGDLATGRLNATDRSPNLT